MENEASLHSRVCAYDCMRAYTKLCVREYSICIQAGDLDEDSEQACVHRLVSLIICTAQSLWLLECMTEHRYFVFTSLFYMNFHTCHIRKEHIQRSSTQQHAYTGTDYISTHVRKNAEIYAYTHAYLHTYWSCRQKRGAYIHEYICMKHSHACMCTYIQKHTYRHISINTCTQCDLQNTWEFSTIFDKSLYQLLL